ncbi:hypothetical protein DFO70_10951 [Cytobacillus firmus]|uniref:Uncharacterized protein n=2 Tax=Cytobacillus TaxID=2675230 RepID=A0A366JRW1_CYTFI|nr:MULTISPECIES: hypothetical protein [Cytobacillus]RBP90546.1 hypothetical protein DFO70_10951 [Cytobacillus firmus]TDX46128.1 hypothetical protein DFO72_102608 [Cytobacillus oceanisediminis]
MLNAPFIKEDGKQDNRILQQKVIYLTAEISKYKNKIKDYQENYHYSQLETLKNENQYLKEQIQKKQQDELDIKEELSSAIAHYKKNLKELSSKEADYLVKIETLDEQIRKSEKLILTLQENNTSIRQEIEEFQKNRLYLHKQLSEKDSELIKLKNENEQLQSKNNEFKDLIVYMRDELNNYSNQLATIEKKDQLIIDDLQYNLSIQKAENEKLLLEILEYRTLISEYEDKIMTNEAYIEELKIKEDTNLQLQQQNEQLQALNRDLYDENVLMEQIQKEIIAQLLLIRDEIKEYPNSPFRSVVVSNSKL